MSDKISIVIPCYNEEKFIEKSLHSLINSDYPSNLIEISVIDGGSTDKSLELIGKLQAQYKNIRVLRNPKKITPVSLNMGILNSTGDFIMIASAHSQFPTDYISSLMDTMQKMNCDCIGGAIETRTISSTPSAIAITKVLSSGYGVGNSTFRIETSEIRYVDTVPFGIYRKSVYTKVGLYNEQLVRNHDIEFSKRLIRAGYKIVLVPSVRCVYYARETYKKLSSNSLSNGFWNLITLYRTKRLGSLSIRHFIPLIFILSLIVPLIAGFWLDSKIIIISLLSLLMYLVFITAASLKIRDNSAGFVYILLSIAVLHFSYGVGSLIGLLRIDKLLFY